MAEDHQPLLYERPSSSSIPRWQFRLLFLLVLLNLAITIQTSYAPGVAAAAKRWWGQYQETRRVQALQRQASDWGESGDKVIWEDDPKAAATLLAGQGYKPIGIPSFVQGNYPILRNWPPGAASQPPQLTSQLFRPHFPPARHRACGRVRAVVAARTLPALDREVQLHWP